MFEYFVSFTHITETRGGQSHGPGGKQVTCETLIHDHDHIKDIERDIARECGYTKVIIHNIQRFPI